MIRRKSEQLVLNNLGKDLILLLIGARQTGKTTILNDIASRFRAENKAVYTFTLEDPQLLSALDTHPENIFNYIPKDNSLKYLLLDEIQYLTNPTNFLKYIYDQYHSHLQIIATGSSAFYIDQKFNDSLAGRKRIIEIPPFSFSEYLLAKSENDLSETIAQNNYWQTKQKRKFLIPEHRQLQQLWIEYFRFGGYPRVVLASDLTEKSILLKELYQSFLKKDIHEAGIKNEAAMYSLIRILANQVGNLVNTAELANVLSISRDTVCNYLYILEKAMIIKLVPTFHQNIRKELTKMPKVFFYDNGYRHAILNNFEALDLRSDSGMSLENHIFAEFVKAGVEDIKYWRTQDKNEIDFILNEKEAFEVKFSKKTYRVSGYKGFCQQYPNIPLKLITSFDEEELDVLDFSC